jgi:signal transduction histidine kinase
MFKAADVQKLTFFEELSTEQAQWVLDNTEIVEFPADAVVFQEGILSNNAWVLIEGGWRFIRKIDGIDNTVIESEQPGTWGAGFPDFKGNYTATSRTTKPSRFFRVRNDQVDEMLKLGFPITNHILNGVRAGTRRYENAVLQREKMAALGKLSAGLAHELNNPAAAARRASQQLRGTLLDINSVASGLASLSKEEFEALQELQQVMIEGAKNPPRLDTLEQSEREDEIANWLEDHAVENGWELAPTLVESGVDTQCLTEIVKSVGETKLAVCLKWTVANLTATQLVNQLENSAERISGLVKAIKEYSYMDQAPLQEIDVHDGLETTMTILNHKLKKGDVKIIREYDKTLPRFNAYASELNQVWTNLLDNAIDALNGNGTIWIRTRRYYEQLIVEIADNGIGIPEEGQSRIFEPFYTTKEVGKGTGLGLDIAYRIVVERHKGEIKVESKPGDTRFQVFLPLNRE